MRGLLHILLVLLTLDMRPEEALRLYGMVAVSFGAHVLAAVVLFLLPAIPLFAEGESVSIEIVEPTPVPLEEEIEEPEPVREPEPPPPEPEPAPIVERRRPEPRPEPVRAEPEPPPQEAPEPPPQEEAVADFSGLTLTNPGAGSWASNVGSGAPLEGPIGQPNAPVTGRRRTGTSDGVPDGTGPAGPPVTAAADLSRQPAPPSERLVRLLEDNYPREARQQGLEGHADVRIRVHADGRVRPMALVRETQDGFGDACQRTLRQGGTWSPPLDRQGRPVDTITVFRCTFSIRF